MNQRLQWVPLISLVLFLVYLAILWVAGGASRADVAGQVVVRVASMVSLGAVAAFGARPWLDVRPVLFLLVVITLIPAIQLIPIPASLWAAVPGRAALIAADLPSSARPLSLVPDLTVNALASLCVPFAGLALIAQLKRPQLLGVDILVLAVLASGVMGLAQLAGVVVENPLINHGLGEVSGNFANRNHFALFLAIGCATLPVWAVQGAEQVRWRGVVGLALVILLLLIVLATGSRSGSVLAVVGTVAGITIVWPGLMRGLRTLPRWLSVVGLVVLIAALAGLIALSFGASRAVALSRVFDQDVAEDLRWRAAPVVFVMAKHFFPVGIGFGGFDPLFRMHEPDALLSPSYLNHAHNDLLEIILEGGVLSLVVLLAALGWWAVASYRVWRAQPESGILNARLGSVIVLLLLLGSAVDYPVRTPMMMMMVVIAAVWLHWGARASFGARAMSGGRSVAKAGQRPGARGG